MFKGFFNFVCLQSMYSYKSINNNKYILAKCLLLNKFAKTQSMLSLAWL